MKYWTSVISLTVMLAATLGLAEKGFAEDTAAINGKGLFYITPGAVIFEGPDNSNIGYEDADVGPGVIIGFGLSERWSAEFLLGRTESSFSNNAGSGEDDIDLRWLDITYKFAPKNAWQPFVLVGGGRATYDFEDVRSSIDDTQYNAGIGVMRSLNDRFALRADFRGVSSNKGSGITPMAFVGLTGYFGKGGTPPPPPPDSDGDGVPNDQDQCPTTPAGRVVDAQGCQLDGDGDGVVDGDDSCPETPAGAPVDRRGCALDSDGDGVPDYRDDCPDSARGARVDERGCYIELEEEVTIDMNIEFDSDSAEIKSSHASEINRTVEFLVQYPTADAVIEGHTDSSGSSSYNQTLSEKRAKAVYEYMINSAGISADRLSSIGFGEDRPKASNDTAEGKQQNRRVSAVVEGTHTVRQ